MLSFPLPSFGIPIDQLIVLPQPERRYEKKIIYYTAQAEFRFRDISASGLNTAIKRGIRNTTTPPRYSAGRYLADIFAIETANE